MILGCTEKITSSNKSFIKTEIPTKFTTYVINEFLERNDTSSIDNLVLNYTRLNSVHRSLDYVSLIEYLIENKELFFDESLYYQVIEEAKTMFEIQIDINEIILPFSNEFNIQFIDHNNECTGINILNPIKRERTINIYEVVSNQFSIAFTEEDHSHFNLVYSMICENIDILELIVFFENSLSIDTLSKHYIDTMSTAIEFYTILVNKGFILDSDDLFLFYGSQCGVCGKYHSKGEKCEAKERLGLYVIPNWEIMISIIDAVYNVTD